MLKFSLPFLVLVVTLATVGGARAREIIAVQDDGSVEIAGHRMECAGVPVAIDDSVPSEGIFVPDEGIFLNPALMQSQPAVVRKFIFAHECAHRSVGGDELGADCAAARQGARERWLNEDGIATICRDLKRHMGDENHPPGVERCANVKRCFAEGLPKTQQTATRDASKASVKTSAKTSEWPATRQAFRSEFAQPPKLPAKTKGETPKREAPPGGDPAKAALRSVSAALVEKLQRAASTWRDGFAANPTP